MSTSYKTFFIISFIGNLILLAYAMMGNLYFENRINQIIKSADSLTKGPTLTGSADQQKIKRIDVRERKNAILKDETLELAGEYMSSKLSETASAVERELYFHFGYILNRLPELNQEQRMQVMHFLLLKKKLMDKIDKTLPYEERNKIFSDTINKNWENLISIIGLDSSRKIEEMLENPQLFYFLDVLKEEEGISSLGDSEFEKIADLYREVQKYKTQLSNIRFDEKDLNQNKLLAENLLKDISYVLNTLDTLPGFAKGLLEHHIIWSLMGGKTEPLLQDIPSQVFGEQYEGGDLRKPKWSFPYEGTRYEDK